jgi:excisionase family DNA binding protein
MSSNENHAVLTVTELCQRWKCSRRSVLDSIRAGKLDAFRLGERAYRIRMEEVLRVELNREKAA